MDVEIAIENKADVWFERLLGRASTALERAELPADDTALVASITDLPEYRNRFRDALRTDANALAAAAIWPAHKRDYDLQVLVISGEGLSKCRSTIERISAELRPRTLLTVLCGEAEEGAVLVADHAELIVVPGASVFQLRALAPTFLRETSWVALVEDHAVPHPGWVGALLDAIGAATPDQIALTGTVSNDVSTSPWSWASFLFNFAYHWHPSAADTLPGTVTTLVLRRDIVGSQPLRIHEFEQFILGRRGPAFNTVRVDHDQPLNWWWASLRTFDNGLVTGSALRRHQESPRGAVVGMVRWVNFGRVAEIEQLLARHPSRAKLPAGTIRRLRWIGLCHSAGVIWGSIFGGGRAHKRLE